MIFCFSGTGNSRWIAQQLAEKTNDETCDIVGLHQPPSLQEQSHVGFVFPIYAWGAAEPMLRFLAALPHTDAFTYAVCTCGADAGKAMKKLSALYPLSSCYSIAMPSNYIVGGDVESEAVIRAKLTAAKEQTTQIAAEILQNQPVYRVHEGSFAALKSGAVTGAFNKYARNTKPFCVTAQCNGCGLCARDCPAKTITLTDGRPVWGEKCYQCLRCINLCPQKAIEYGKATETRGRYQLSRYL